MRTAIHLVHVAQHLLRQQQVSTAVDESEHAHHRRTFDGVLRAGAARDFYVVCVSGAVSHAGSRAVPDDVNGVLARPPRQPIMSAAAVC